LSPTPGPGRYSTAKSTLRLDKKFTMKKKYNQRLNQTLPGPADYSLNDEKIKGGRIGKTKRIFGAKKSIDPSPGSYTPIYRHIKKRTPRYSFPSSRKPIIIEQTPGPADNSVRSMFKRK